jgi:hypothetical protein
MKNCLDGGVRTGKDACVLQPGRLQGRAAKLLLVRRKSLYNAGLYQFALRLAYKGTFYTFIHQVLITILQRVFNKDKLPVMLFRILYGNTF